MTSKSMRNKMKKAFVCTLSVAVLMSSVAVPAFAAEEDTVISVEDAEEETDVAEADEAEFNTEDAIEMEASEDTDPVEETENDAEEAFDDAAEEALNDGSEANTYSVSFTSYDGKTVVNDAVKDGVQMKVQDVPASQNIGQLKVNGFNGKVAWLLSLYNDKTHVDSTESNIWPNINTGELAVKGIGEATIIAWDADTLSHTVDKQDVPKTDSVKLAEIKVTITSDKVEELRLLANGNEIKNNLLAVNGSEWISFVPQTRAEGSNEWKTVPVSSVTFPASTTDKNYEPLVTNTEAKYRARGYGKDFDLKVTGYGKTYTVHVTTSYVPVKAIKPSVSGTVKVYPSDYKGDGSQIILGTVITRDVFNGSVVVTPENASYADSWTMTSSDEDVVEYNAGNGTVGIMPKKIGEATLKVKSEDPGLSAQVSGSADVKFVYADEVAVSEFNKVMNKLPNVTELTKADEETVKEAEFIYNNMSAANKTKVSKENTELLAKYRDKLNGNFKAEDTKKPQEEKAAITLYYKNITLAEKQSTSAVTLKNATVKGDKIKAATSNNKKVAAVSVKNGKLTVKGLKKGTATVTVTSVKGATTKLTVKVQKKAVALKKLSAAVQKKWTVKKGKKVTLKVVKAPVTAAGTIKWTSSNKKVATVSSKGIVKAKKKGTAVITAKVGNKKVSFKVTVK